MSTLSCSKCVKLLIEITEKDIEIKKLALEIQHLTESLKFYEKQSCRRCYCSKDVTTELNEEYSANYKKEMNNSSLCTVLPKCEETSSNLPKSIIKEDKENICDSEETNKFQSSDEYVYDENYKMYYCVSTGYYYDRNTSLYFVPQNGAYYTYDYSENAYVLYDGYKTVADHDNRKNKNSVPEADDTNKETENESSKADDSCESVVDQVNNLNINDIECNINSAVPLIAENHVLSDTCDSVKEDSQKNKTHCEVTNIWGTSADSIQTIHDIVKEVAEQNCGISDYIYDEKYQMYYSTSTGYYYDAIRKLLYDPQSGIYYKYDEDTSSYDFHYQVDLNAIETQKKTKQASIKNKARRRYWRKKLNVCEEKCDSPKSPVKIDKDEESYSSPEEGELFSSESDQDTESNTEAFSFLTNSSDNYSPCIRAIVKKSTKLKIGTLLLITCSGAVIGRDKTNDIHIPEIGVSKTHAEVLFNSELWKYVIKDLGSQNGTFVNDSRLSEPKESSSPCVLNHGDIISIGTCKLMFHIHVGRETCDECEPGQVMAEKLSKDEKLTSAYKTKEEKEKERRQEVRRLKKKYGLESMAYVEGKSSSTITGYEDKAEIRRKTMGSENPYEKTETSSLERTVNESNKGYQMLKKLGWKEGDSLGATGIGLSEPIPLRPWLSKAGLGSSEEQQASMMTVAQDKRNKKWVLAQERFLKLT